MRELHHMRELSLADTEVEMLPLTIRHPYTVDTGHIEKGTVFTMYSLDPLTDLNTKKTLLLSYNEPPACYNLVAAVGFPRPYCPRFHCCPSNHSENPCDCRPHPPPPDTLAQSLDDIADVLDTLETPALGFLLEDFRQRAIRTIIQEWTLDHI